MATKKRCGQRYDRIICLTLRSVQLAMCIVALAFVGASFQSHTLSFETDDGETHDVTVYYGGPAVNLVMVVTFAACLYDLYFLLLVYTLQCASIRASFSFGVDVTFTLLFVSAGCALAASDYLRYCSALDLKVHCALLASGTALCFMAFGSFLLCVAWGAWMWNRRIQPSEKDQLVYRRGSLSSSVHFGVGLEFETATTSYVHRMSDDIM
ncbi:hypothetical protein CCR75_001616 [Bremia lactucae]|uniref:MARVEL domain-containing protein n=1 Tax=Bremia lactucae TaxID=4779 RepID=A0A976FNZ2_BRELC|nr:hypothetical protein CCR75_001616 [Bremia lactucae]